jgi:hypothetical protein
VIGMAQLFPTTVALAALAVFTACGGNVVVGTGPTGTTGAGAGGAGNSGGVVGASSTGGAPALFCGAPAGVSGLFNCGAPASAGAGGAASCESTFCVPLGEEIWVVSCHGATCDCAVQGGGGGVGPVMPVCTCVLPGGADACQTGTNCCFTQP